MRTYVFYRAGFFVDLRLAAIDCLAEVIKGITDVTVSSWCINCIKCSAVIICKYIHVLF